MIKALRRPVESAVGAAPEWEQRVREHLAAIGRRVEVVLADPEALELPGEGTTAKTPPPAADSLALLMYTSGTTGVTRA